ncbi:Fic family protein [Verrucomicrobium sp. 3C]|uniref:Fic family protein n=1 Tax=Verrucomicrobium sp. 3C TaxID=1134055 RepID=UPI000368ACAA|nr:Fic family protein [Verrucomicrobium sp. 3C]
MRTFERTHPWISFQLDLTRAAPRFWLLLGEAASKCEHLVGVPLRPDFARKMHQIYLAKGALATTAIEGNTLTEEQVLRALGDELHLPPSQQYLKKEVDNIVGACNRIQQELKEGEIVLTRESLCLLNRWVLEGLPQAEEAVPGRLRTHSVVVGRYRGAPAEDGEFLLDRLCEWLSGPDFRPPSGEWTIPYAIIQAVVGHVYLAWIHPFGDGNGRTARLLEFELLLSAGLPSVAAHLLSNYYNRTRAHYYARLDRSSKKGESLLPFLEYAVEGFVEELRAQVAEIREQQLELVWRNYVHERFPDKNSPANARRRRLLLDLGKKSVPVSKLSEISPRVAAGYAGKTPVTLRRDCRVLEAMDLLERTPTGVRAKQEVVRAFLPWRKKKAGAGTGPSSESEPVLR